MTKQKSKVYKEENYIAIYQKLLKPEFIYKKYRYDNDFFESFEELEGMRERMIAMQNNDNWPNFVVKPTHISPLYEPSFYQREFIVEFPFIDGISLKDYLAVNNLDFKTCIQFISSLEKRILGEKDKVFLDVANPNNIILLPDEKEYVLIDPDDIQFDKYPSNGCARLLGTRPIFSEKDDFSRGIKKCLIDEKNVNKQMDIRSMYALFYYILRREYFYPSIFEKNQSEYIEDLKKYNVPEGSLLYRNTLATLSEDDENKPISEALYELLDMGYEFERANDKQYVYKLQNRKK